MLRRFYCRCCSQRGGLPSLLPAYPAFSLLYRPLSPQPPSPAGKGEPQSLFRRGLRPRHPCIRLLAALTDPARTGARRHHSQGTDSCRFCGEPWVQPRGCKGRSPLHKKTKNLPLPAGKGAGGIGAESKLKAGAAGDKQGKPPLRFRNGKVSRQPAGQATRRARGSPLATVPPGAPLQPNHAGITCCFGDNITKIP